MLFTLLVSAAVCASFGKRSHVAQLPGLPAGRQCDAVSAPACGPSFPDGDGIVALPDGREWCHWYWGNTCADEEACSRAATDWGLVIGTEENSGYAFAGNYGTKGCYAYCSGQYQGKVYFGTGGNSTTASAEHIDPKYRFKC